MTAEAAAVPLPADRRPPPPRPCRPHHGSPSRPRSSRPPRGGRWGWPSSSSRPSGASRGGSSTTPTLSTVRCTRASARRPRRPGLPWRCRRSDWLTSTHRAHHDVIAKLLLGATPDDFDPFTADTVTEAMVDPVQRTLAEIMGLEQGLCHGRGGSMHLWDRDGGVMTSAIVGGGIPAAAGFALASKLRDSGDVGVACFGDGATQIGAFHEAAALARAWDLPLILLLENNQYSVATPVVETAGFTQLALRAGGYDMPALVVDGMDPIATFEAMRQARAHALSQGPIFVEAVTYRFYHQNGPLPGSAFKYRSKDEEQAWRAARSGRGLSPAARGGRPREPGRGAPHPGPRRRARVAVCRSPDDRDARWPAGAARVVPARRGRQARHARPRAAEAARQCARRDASGQRPGDHLHGGHPGRHRPRPRARSGSLRPGRRGGPPWGRRDGPDQGLPSPQHRSACSARRSARTASAAQRSVPRLPECTPSSSSCTPTSCSRPPTSSSTTSPRAVTCSAGTTRCPSSCAPRSAAGAATDRSTARTPPRCSRCSRAGEWSPRPRHPTTWAASTPRC